MTVRALRIGTRGSALARWQANTVAALLGDRGCTVEVTTIRTAGDRLQETPQEPSLGKGVFVKEIEEALLARGIDLAVHSAKDMPAVLPDGLSIGAVLAREDPRDALVLRDAPVAVTTMSAAVRASDSALHGTARPPSCAASASAVASVRPAMVIWLTCCARRCTPVNSAISPAPRMSTFSPFRSRKIFRASAIAA